MLKIQPVESAPKPQYPDKYSPESKQALAEARPRRWAKAPLALSLSAALALGLGGCREYTTDGVPPIPAYPQGQITGENGNTDYILFGEPAPMPVYDLFIPLFEFGEGTGSIGCDAVNSPSFMSEEEAFAILISEFERVGLSLERGTYPLSGMNIPVTELYSRDSSSSEIQTGELTADSLTGDYWNLPVMFISRSDVENWENPGNYSSVSSYNIKGTAQTLAENNPGLVVFYDPITFIDNDNVDKMRYTTPKEAEELLRQQAGAFVEWLVSRGMCSLPEVTTAPPPVVTTAPPTDFVTLGTITMPVITTPPEYDEPYVIMGEMPIPMIQDVDFDDDDDYYGHVTLGVLPMPDWMEQGED